MTSAMHRRAVATVIGGLVLGAGILVLLLATRSSEPVTPPAADQSGAPQAIAAPDFSFTLYQGEDEPGFSEGRFSHLFGQGKPVVLNFWAGLCPPCRAEMPAFEKIYQEHRGRFILFGLDVGPYTGLGSQEDGIALMKEMGVTYPVGFSPESSVVREYEILGMPTTVFLTADGRVVAKHTGLLIEEQLREQVRALITQSKR